MCVEGEGDVCGGERGACACVWRGQGAISEGGVHEPREGGAAPLNH